MRLVGMALGAALTCFVFYRNHKNRTYKRNLKDLIQEFDTVSYTHLDVYKRQDEVLRYGRRKAADRREDEAASHKAVWGILP